MNQPCNVVACTDLSQPALLAISRALALTELFQGHCTVLHVLPKLGLHDLQHYVGAEHNPQFARQAIELQTQELNRQVDALLHSRPLSIRTRVRLGQPTQQIVKQVQKAQADIIVMGFHGQGHVGHLLMGSTVRAVLNQSACPVLVVRVPQQMPYRKVLFALDLMPANLELIKKARTLTLDAHCVLAHVLRNTVQDLVDLGLLAQANRASCQESVIIDTYARLGMMALRAGLSQGRFQIEIITAHSAHALLEHAHRHKFDLIVVAKYSPQGNQDCHRLLGSFTQTVLTHSLCDVLILSPTLPNNVYPIQPNT